MTIAKLKPQPRGSVRALSLLGLLIIAVISVVSAAVLSQFLRENLLHRDAVVTQELVQSVAYTHNAGGYFATDRSAGKEAPLERFFAQVINLPDVVRGNAFAIDGTILWSNQRQLIGESFGDNEELLRALNGELVVETGRLETTDKSEHILFEWRFDEWFVESYIPIRDGGDVVGVVELYKIPHALADTIAKTTLIVWAGVLLGGLLFFAAMLWFMPGRSAATATPAPGPAPVPRSEPFAEAVALAKDADFSDTFRFDPRAEMSRAATHRRRRWVPAVVVLALALFGPVIAGTGVLYFYGVGEDGPLGALANTEQSPLGFVASAAATLITGPPPMQESGPPAPVDFKPPPADLTPQWEEGEAALRAQQAEDERTAAQPLQTAATKPAEPIESKRAMAAPSVAKPLAERGSIALSEQEMTRTGPDPQQTSPAELLFWQTIKDSSDGNAYRAYIEQFPDGVFVGLAKNRIQQLRRRAAKEVLLLLTKAKSAIANRALTTPAEDNAVRWALAALQLDPESTGARQVLSQVIETYLDWAGQSSKRGKPELAATYLQRVRALRRFASPEQRQTLASLITVLRQAFDNGPAG